jgi:hypothetical protein
MNVGELMAQLAKLPPDMPVVVAQEDEPLGPYGITGVDRVRMRRDDFWSHREVWEHHGGYTIDPALVEVCYLETDEPPTQIVDAEVVEHRAAIEGYDRDTRTLATADQAHADFVSMPAALAALDARCVGCGQPAPPGKLCPACTTVFEGRHR